MTTPAPMLNYSRFHAIVSARPFHAHGPPVVPEGLYHLPHEPGGPQFQNEKSQTDDNNAGPSGEKRAARRSSEDDQSSGREPTTHYSDRTSLLVALKERFMEGSHVDFHGAYEMVDSGVNHKQSIQMVAHEIWKATGYRFTVKDHPHFINGHKTRFWCSQDDAHRSKSSRAARKAQGTDYKPRTTSAGETMAKARYPCRSRLLISSRDASTPGTRIITVRMHHHVKHEPYINTNLPPDIIKSIWERFGMIAQSRSTTAGSRTESDGSSAPTASRFFMEEEEESDGDVVSVGDNPEPSNINHAIAREPVSSIVDASRLLRPSAPDSEDYRNRMRVHIQNLRQFCDGLEYQLQFNDCRMLELLENEGRPFLDFVATCLSREGRLTTTDNPNISRQSSNQLSALGSGIHFNSIRRSRQYNGNTGVNPEALG